MKKILPIIFMCGCAADPPPKLIMSAPAPLPVESGPTTHWEPKAFKPAIRITPSESENLVNKSVEEQINKVTNKTPAVSVDPAPPLPGQSDSRAQPANKVKAWHEILGRPGLYAYGYLDQSTNPPTITQIDFYYQLPNK